MKLRLPLMLLAAVLATFPAVYGATVDEWSTGNSESGSSLSVLGRSAYSFGEVPFAMAPRADLIELLPQGNSADVSYKLSSSLIMTNTAAETVAGLSIQDLTGASILTLGSGGLSVTGNLSFDGFQAVNIVGGSLSAGEISVTGRGVLTIASDLKVDSQKATTISSDAKSVVNLGKVALNGGELVFSSQGRVNVADLAVGAEGGTLAWSEGSKTDVSGNLNFTKAGVTLVLNTGEAGLVFNSVVVGTGSTLSLASGKLTMVQGQTQNIKVDAGAELTFNVTGETNTASGSFSGKGTVILQNRTNSDWSLTEKQLFGSEWADFGGRLILDPGVRQFRQLVTKVIGQALPNGEKAVVEVKNGAQFYDGADGSIVRNCDWVLSGVGYSPGEGMGALRVREGATYAGNITVQAGGANIGGANAGVTTTFTGNISGDTLSLGTVSSSNSWGIVAELSGNNSELNGINVLHGTVIASSATSLGKNLNLINGKGTSGTELNSVARINADVILETCRGIAGSVVDIVEEKSLTLTGNGTGSFAGTLSGKGSLKLQGNASMALSGDSSSYEGKVVIDGNSVLTVTGTASVAGLSGTGNLLLKGTGNLTVKGLTAGDHSLGGVSFSSGGTLSIQTAGIGSQSFGGVTLLDGINSLVVDANAGALNLNMGTISGSGVLIVSGLDSFAGALGEGVSLDGILFRGNDGLYESVSSGDNINKGTARIGELQASGNTSGKTYMLSGNLTMTNSASETVGRILAQGFAANSTLTLGAGGLVVSDTFLFNGDGKELTVAGASLSAGAITATGSGVLTVNSELVINGKKTTAVKNSAGTTLSLANVSLNDGTLTLSGIVGVTALKVGAAGGTVSWLDGSISDVSPGLTFAAAGATLILNSGNGGLVFNNVVSGTGSTLNLASGKMSMALGQTQNFRVDAGAELTFNAASNVKVAAGSFTGNGTVVVKNTSGGTLALDAGFGGDLMNYGGRLVLDGNGQQMRVGITTIVGASLANGEKAVVEVKNGAQYYDDISESTVRSNDWVLSGVGYKPATTEEGMGSLRVKVGATYGGNITIAPGGARIGAAGGAMTYFTGNISGDTLQLGAQGWNDAWFLKAQLSGDNSGLKGIEVLRADVTAVSSTALGKNLNLAIGTGNNLSKVNIAADVVLETLKGVAGSVLDIAESKSLSLTGTGTSSFAGNLTGKGRLLLQDSVNATLSGNSTSYEGTISIDENASLVIGGGTTVVNGLSGTGNLLLKGGGVLTMKGLSAGAGFQGETSFSGGGTLKLQTASAGSLTLGGVSLLDGINSLVVDAGAGALTLDTGIIRGSGILVVSGLDSFSGTFGAGASADGIFFQKTDGLYESVVTGGSIGIGASKIGALLATGNEAGKTYTLAQDLTMTNAAGESVRRVLAQGFTANSTLTLAAGGLVVTDVFAFNGGGKDLTVTGSKLSAGAITATGGGTLAVNSELVVDGKRTTAVSNVAGTNLTLANVTLNDGTLTLSGTVGVTALNVGATGGTISWLNGCTTDVSTALTLTTAGSTLVLNAGTGGLAFSQVIKSATEGAVSTVELASGKLQVEQEQVQNFKIDAGAELTFNITGEKKTASGSFSGNGTVILLNKTSSDWSLTDDQWFGSDWTKFGGHLVMDAGGRQFRQKITTVVGSALTDGEKAVVEVKNGAQFYDGADVAITRTCDWVLGYGTWSSEGMGAFRVCEGATYSGNIAILPGGSWIGGSSSSSTTRFTGNISGDKLILGSDGWRDWSIKSELSGDNSELKVLNVLRGTVIASSATALGKNVNLTKNTTKEGDTGTWTASVINIAADVAVETFNGITGSVIDIAEARSLTATGTGTSVFTGTLTGKGALNLNGAGLVTLDGDYSGYGGAITVGKDASLTLIGTVAGYSGAITVGEGGRLVAASKTALGAPASIAVNGGTFRYEGEDFVAMPVSLDKGGVLNFAQSQTLTRNVSGKGSIAMDAGRSLSIQGNILGGGVGLTFNGDNILTFSGMSTGGMVLGVLSVSGTGNTVNYETGVNLILNMGGLMLKEGSALDVENYTYNKNNYISFAGTTAWKKLEGVTINGGTAAMVDTLGRLTEYQEDVMVGSLVSSGTKTDGSGYTYSSNAQYYGALAGWDVDFSQPFKFASGAFTYGFTTVDDVNSGLSAGSFKVSGLMTDDGSTSRVVSIIGQAGAADRTVTLTNTGNSFTGNVTVTNATLKADADRPEAIQHTAVTILGKGNTVFLQENATLNLATGDGAYTYANNFTLAGANSLLTQTEGQHTFTGTITVQGSDRGSRVIENALEEGTLTLVGALNVRGENTLTLRTKSGEDSLIVLALNGNAVLSSLNVQGHVRQTKNTVSVTGGMTLGSNGSYDLTGGVLAVGGVLSSSDAGDRVITMGNGTTLAVAGDRLEVKRGVTLAFAQEQTSFVVDTGAGTLNFQGSLGKATVNNTLVKRGAGVFELAGNLSTKAMIKVEQGTLSLNEGVSLTSEGDFTVQNGGTLNLSKGSTLTLSSSRTLTFNGSLTGKGSISGVDSLTFGNGTRYAAEMSGQTWNADFKMGSTFSGSLLKHAGNIVFDKGSHIMFDTTLPVSDDSIGISTSGNATVRFNGATVGGTTSSPEVDWDSTQSYVFTLVQSQKELLGSDGQALTQDNLGQSVTVGGDGWGAFLQGELSLSEDGKDLFATVTRNGNTISSYAQTGNQTVVAGALDYAMDNYSSLGLRGTELGDIIQYFNKMGQNIATLAPEALGMVGGLSNYQALAGQRTDMMHHLEAVRQRAHAGKGLVGISNIPDNSFWAEGTQSYSRVDGVDSSAPGYTAQTWGAAIGVDYLSGPNYSLGVAFAYSNMTVGSNEYAGQTKSDNYYVDLYGRWESGNWNGVVVLSGGTATVDVKRTLTTGKDSYQGTGSADGTQIIGMAEVAYDWQWEEEGPVLQPYLGMAVGGSKLDGYTESGLGNAGLVIDEQKQTVAQASLGVRLYKQNIDREMQYETSRWELRAGLVEEFGNTDFTTRSSFIGLPGYTMSTKSDDIGRTGLQIGGGFSYAFDEAWSVFGDVNGEFRNGQTNMNSTLGLRCTF